MADPRVVAANRPPPPTHEDVARQLEIVEQFLLQSVPDSQIIRYCQNEFGIGRTRAKKRIATIRERWATEDEEVTSHMRAQQLRSVATSLATIEARIAEHQAAANRARVAGQTVPDLPIALLREKRAFLELQVDLLGTRAPQKVDVKVTAQVTMQKAMVNVIMGLSADDIAERVQKIREDRQLASEYRREHGITPEHDGSDGNDRSER